MLGEPAWTFEKLDSAGTIEPVPAAWTDPLIYWRADSASLTLIYSDGFQGEVIPFDLAGARGDTLLGTTAYTSDMGPYESQATRVTAVRRSCPGARLHAPGGGT